MQSSLRLDASTGLPSIHSSDELDAWLRGGAGSRSGFSESLSHLAVHVEAVVAGLWLSRSRERVAPMLVDLLTALRAHCHLVAALGPSWHSLYEHDNHLQSVHQLRSTVAQRLLARGEPAADLPLTPEEFELWAWRALGAGLLLVDMHAQLAGDPQPTTRPDTLTGDDNDSPTTTPWWRLKLR